ncbi:MAG TPA: M14 family zinc carboxypeptidase [Pirellulales bacterium]|nr:M14 family zinc carboxypeptidase [Pirellulales bacterium]
MSRWAICLALSLVCWLALALAVWAQAPSRAYPAFAPRAVAAGGNAPPAARATRTTASAPTATNPPPAPPAASDPLVNWQPLGRSAQGRAIEYVQFGSGEHQVLVIGALRGNEPEGVAQAQSLASHLARFPRRLEDVTITIVRDPNPDGRARRIAGNARGVELNQNFLAARQSPANPAVPGVAVQAGSEPETIALVELLHDVKPERVILFGTSNSRGTVTFTGPAEPLAAQVALEGGSHLSPLDTSAAPGALLTLTGINMGIPSLEIATMPRATADAVWSQQKRAIMTAVGCGTPLPFVRVPNQPARPKPMNANSSANFVRPGQALSPAGIGTMPPANAAMQGGMNQTAFAGQPAPMAGGAPSTLGPDAPQTLNFSELRFGKPTVQVQSPRAARSRRGSSAAAPAGQPVVASPPAVAGSEIKRPAAGGYDPRVRRLPPVQMYQPVQREFAADQPLPQRPIPVYPSTGQ